MFLYFWIDESVLYSSIDIQICTDVSLLPFVIDREGLPHGLALSGTKFNISKVKVKDYAHKFFCHFIYGSQQFTAYIKLEHPGKRSLLDKMIIDLLLSLTMLYLRVKAV